MLVGCSSLGPAGLRQGRGTWAEALAATDAEQTLTKVVRGRFAERTVMLTVSSITANWSYQLEPGVNVGFGSASSYAGNLVPFSLSAIIEENPTVSYMPVQGRSYITQFLEPIPAVTVARVIAGAVTEQETAMAVRLLMAEINGLTRPLLLDPLFADADGAAERRRRFDEMAGVIARLVHLGVVQLVRTENHTLGLLIRVRDHSREAVTRLIEFAGRPTAAEESEAVLLQLSEIAMNLGEGVIYVRMRSVDDLLRLAMASVEVPEPLQPLSLELRPAPGFEGMLRIRSGREAPATAFVAVPYRDWWFWIDETDLTSKRFFMKLQTLQTLMQSETPSAAPVLTLPVAG